MYGLCTEYTSHANTIIYFLKISYITYKVLNKFVFFEQYLLKGLSAKMFIKKTV